MITAEVLLLLDDTTMAEQIPGATAIVTAVCDGGDSLTIASAANLKELFSQDGVQCVGFSPDEVAQMVNVMSVWLANRTVGVSCDEAGRCEPEPTTTVVVCVDEAGRAVVCDVPCRDEAGVACVEVGVPPFVPPADLPATGIDVAFAVVAALFVAVGLGVRRVARRA